MESAPTWNVFPTRKRSGSGDRFLFTDPRLCAGSLSESVELENVIAVRMSQQNELELEPVSINRFKHVVAVRPGIKSNSLPCGRIPHEVRIHSHVFEGRIELREPVHERNFRGPIVRPSDCRDAVRMQVEHRSQSTHPGLIK